MKQAKEVDASNGGWPDVLRRVAVGQSFKVSDCAFPLHPNPLPEGEGTLHWRRDSSKRLLTDFTYWHVIIFLGAIRNIVASDSCVFLRAQG